MREIKFRGISLDTGKWVYGDKIGENWINELISPERPHYVIRDEYIVQLIEVNPETVGQYTGLKDKNGKEIYEGDMCKTDEGYECFVEWDNTESCFYFIDPMDGKAMIDTLDADLTITVIGNKFESSEI